MRRGEISISVDELVNLKKLEQLLYSRMNAALRSKKQELMRVSDNVVLKQPRRLFDQQMQQVDLLKQRLTSSMGDKTQNLNHQVSLLKERLNKRLLLQQIENLKHQNAFLQQNLFARIKVILSRKRNENKIAVNKLDSSSPLKLIGRGYVLATSTDETIISVNQVEPGQMLDLHFKDGIVKSKVSEIEEKQND